MGKIKGTCSIMTYVRPHKQSGFYGLKSTTSIGYSSRINHRFRYFDKFEGAFSASD